MGRQSAGRKMGKVVMISDVWLRRVTQWMLSAALVAGIAGLAWYSSSKNLRTEEDASVGPQAMGPAASSSGDEDPSETDSSETYSMPACVELEQAVQGLDDARKALLREAAAGGGETAIQAVRSYQLAVEAVRQKAERVRSRVMPDEYRGFWERLEAERKDGHEDESGLAEVQLGILSVRRTP